MSSRPSAASPRASVARWDGTSWSQVGDGLTQGVGGFTPTVFALCVHDDGSGPSLFAAGQFTHSGSTFTNGVARWDGTRVATDGRGRAGRDVCDDFVARSERPRAGRVRLRWCGTRADDSFQLVNGAWSAFPANQMGVLFAFDSGASGGQDLYVNAPPLASTGVASDYLSVLHGCALDGAPFCAGDGLDPGVTTACPCGNFGASGHGCANSIDAAGALLDVFGATAADDVVLTGTACRRRRGVSSSRATRTSRAASCSATACAASAARSCASGRYWVRWNGQLPRHRTPPRVDARRNVTGQRSHCDLPDVLPQRGRALLSADVVQRDERVADHLVEPARRVRRSTPPRRRAASDLGSADSKLAEKDEGR